MSNRLPRDLQNEILVSLPVKSLLRFQSVSKTWKSLITSPTFISMHVEHSESTDNYAHLLHWQRHIKFHTEYQLHQMDGSFSEFQKLETPCQIGDRDYDDVLDCKGLILFRTICQLRRDVESLILWNPAIRMSMSLPRPCINVATSGKHNVYGFGFDHTSNDYKVLRLVTGRHKFFPPQAELYKLRTGAWETVRIAENFQCAIHEDTQALVNGASHWVGNHKRDMTSDSPKLVIVLFHMCDEEFRVMKLPDYLSSIYVNHAFLEVSGGLLSLMEYNRQQNVNLSCSIWLMKEYGVIESWTKQFTIDLDFGMFTFRNNQKILGKKQSKPVLYDPNTHRFINLGIKDEGYSVYAKNTFVESLVLLNKVNPIQTCRTCLRKGRWCDSKKIRKRKQNKDMQEGRLKSKAQSTE